MKSDLAVIQKQELVVYLYVYTWQDQSIGAQHWYAELDARGECSVDVDAPLTQAHATMLNKYNRRRGHTWDIFEPGAMYKGFLGWEKAANRGMEMWQEVFPGTTVLLLGRPASGSPMPIIHAPEGVSVEALNELAGVFPEMGWYRAHYERGAEDHNAYLENIDEAWYKLLNEGLA